MSGDSSKFDHVVKYKKGRTEGHRTFEKRTRTKSSFIIKIEQAGQMWFSCDRDLDWSRTIQSHQIFSTLEELVISPVNNLRWELRTFFSSDVLYLIIVFARLTLLR